MINIWSYLGERWLSKIQTGHLRLITVENTIKEYGDRKDALKATVKLNSNRVFKEIFLYGSIGFTESFMRGDFECEDLTSLIKIGLANSDLLRIKSNDRKFLSLSTLFSLGNRFRHWLNRNSRSNSKENISAHYDLSNDFFKLMLDNTMMYSCALFKEPHEDLYEAQKRKIDHLASKLNIKEGDTVLEIGSGWGEMAIYLAKTYSCRVKTLTLSKEQKAFCEHKIKTQGLEENIEVLLQDYREVKGKFDAIISIEMFEAVGKEYFHTFFKQCQRLLKPSGLLVMQVITIPDQRYKSYSKGIDFIQKYIFPGGHLPSIHKILDTTHRYTQFNLANLEDFTEDYAITLRHWYDNFNTKLKEIKQLGFDDYFIRMWKTYLCYCEAGFLTKNITLTQFVFSSDYQTVKQ